MPLAFHPLRTFGDLAAFDLEAEIYCRCRRHAIINGAADAFRNRSIGTRFRCTTLLARRECNERHHASIVKRGRAGWNLDGHWRAMRDRNPVEVEPQRIRTHRDLVQAGHIAWLDHTCRHPEGYSFKMVAFDEPPWDRFLDTPLNAIACPLCRQPLTLRYTYGNAGMGGNKRVESAA